MNGDDFAGILPLIGIYYIAVGIFQPIIVGYIASRKRRDGLLYFSVAFLGCGVALLTGGFLGGMLVLGAVGTAFSMSLTIESFILLVVGTVALIASFLPLILVSRLPSRVVPKLPPKRLRSWVEESALRLRGVRSAKDAASHRCPHSCVPSSSAGQHLGR